MSIAIVYMRIQCSERNAEVLMDDVEGTELTIESLVSGALLEVFDSVQVENVTFQSSSKHPLRYKLQDYTHGDSL